MKERRIRFDSMNIYCLADIFEYFPHYRMIQKTKHEDNHGYPFMQIRYIVTSDYDSDEGACRIPRKKLYHGLDDQRDNDPYFKYIINKFQEDTNQFRKKHMELFRAGLRRERAREMGGLV